MLLTSFSFLVFVWNVFLLVNAVQKHASVSSRTWASKHGLTCDSGGFSLTSIRLCLELRPAVIYFMLYLCFYTVILDHNPCVRLYSTQTQHRRFYLALHTPCSKSAPGYTCKCCMYSVQVICKSRRTLTQTYLRLLKFNSQALPEVCTWS